MLVALDVPGVTAHLQDHVFDTAAAGEHPVGCLEITYSFTLIFRKWKLLLRFYVSVWNRLMIRLRSNNISKPNTLGVTVNIFPHLCGTILNSTVFCEQPVETDTRETECPPLSQNINLFNSKNN